MKIIVSHDIDHWQWRDHFFRDLFVPKQVIRTTALVCTRQIPWRIAARRFEWMWRKQQHRLEELIAFNHEHTIPATFFVAVRRGRSLSYSHDTAAEIISWLRAHGCEKTGVHGIAFDDAESILAEHDTFERIVGHQRFGIRTHYLRTSTDTLTLFAKAGYTYDSSTEGYVPPYVVDGMVEFPLAVMDGRFLRPGRNNLANAMRQTWSRVGAAEASGAPIFVVNFHDPYFSEAYPQHRDWYKSLIRELIHRGYEFTDFAAARTSVLAGDGVKLER